MSFEKWLIDGELCRRLRKTIAVRDIAVDSREVDTIKSVGSDRNHLVHPAIHKHRRSLYHPIYLHEMITKVGGTAAIDAFLKLQPKPCPNA